jgi:hypothetical protein
MYDFCVYPLFLFRHLLSSNKELAAADLLRFSESFLIRFEDGHSCQLWVWNSNESRAGEGWFTFILQNAIILSKAPGQRSMASGVTQQKPCFEPNQTLTDGSGARDGRIFLRIGRLPPELIV